MIRINTARNICANWHGGQWSALYSFSSTGIYFLEYALKYLREIEDCLHPEYKLYPGTLTKGQEIELTKLKAFFTNEGKKTGLIFEYHKHEIYGYLIPYICDNVSGQISDKVQSLQYAI